MKRHLLLLILLFPALAYGQEAGMFHADSVALPRKASRCFVDADSTHIGMIFEKKDQKGEGRKDADELWIFNLATKQFTIKTKLKKKRNMIALLPQGLLMMDANTEMGEPEYTLFDKDTGKVVWSRTLRRIGIAAEAGVALFASADGSRNIVAIDLKTGGKRWEETMPKSFLRVKALRVKDFREDKFLLLADKAYLFSADKGLINSYDLHTSAFIVAPSVLIARDRIFVNDTKNIYCFDEGLNLMWRNAHATTTIAEMTVSGDNLMLTNCGYFFNDGILMPKTRIGKPFVAAYDIANGTMQGEMEFDRKRYGDINAIGKDSMLYVFHKSDCTFEKQNIPHSSSMLCVSDEPGDTYVVSPTDNKVYRYDDETTYFNMFELQGMACVGRYCEKYGNDFWMVDNAGKPLWHFPRKTLYTTKAGNTIYFITETSLNWLSRF